MNLKISKPPVLLIIDDDSTQRLLARESLEYAGYEVHEASNGMTGLSFFGSLQPDLVLLDVMMPDLNGFEVSERIRKLPGGSEIPVLMMTSLDDTDSINKAYESGITDFITKPINWLLLAYRVRYILRANLTNRELQRSKAKLSNAQRIAKIGYWEWDLKTNVFHWSDELHQLFSSRKDSNRTDMNFMKFVHPDDHMEVRDSLKQIIKTKGSQNIDYRILLPDGSTRFVHQHAEVALDETGKPIWMGGTIQDITERKQAEQQITYLAYYDSLTGLPNRELFKKMLTQTLAYAERHNNLFALIFLDLDQFKRLNDTLGHTLGDLLLKSVAERLQGCVRSSDCFARHRSQDAIPGIARLGGDEFIILLSRIKDVMDAAKVAQRILSSFSEPFKVEAHDAFITASLGISLYPSDGQEVETLLKNADAAMYHAKSQGRNNFQFFRKSMNSAVSERLALENSLRRAVANNELFLLYQPKIEVCSGAIIGVEALLRWHHPEMGLMMPSQFIPVAEETGLIIPIGEWVLRTACLQGRAWQLAGLPPLRVAINVSSVQFRNPGKLIGIVAEVLQSSGLNPDLLELELTESLLMENEEQSIATLGQLRALGVRVSIDDFGTGYSSLSYLTRFPIDEMKIDRSFLKGVPHDNANTAIASAIIAMAHTMNLKAIAEGVETEQQLAFLREQGCDGIQGFLIGKPIQAEQVASMLKKKDHFWLQ